MTEKRLSDWVIHWPILNPWIHLACILDPVKGEIRFLEGGHEGWIFDDET